MDLLQGKDIVIIGLQPWYYEIGSNCKNIATRLGEHNRVLYVNLPVNRKTFPSRDKSPGIESINCLPFTRAFQAVNYFNIRRFATDIRKALYTLGFNNIILLNDNDILSDSFSKNYYTHPSMSIIAGISSRPMTSILSWSIPSPVANTP
jgi:teichuronic acid biosynthesis glycosyltransferase TuaH